MVIKVLSSYNGEARALTEEVIRSLGHELYAGSGGFDINVCPDYETLLSVPELSEPRIGTLVFHPSPLPRMRGRNAIKRQYKAGDKIGGGTWFWADNTIDKGRIEEQELVIIEGAVRPSEYYAKVILPLMVRTLGRALLKVKVAGACLNFTSSEL